MQIVQELCKRPGLNKAGFDMPTIYVPTLAEKPGRCVNQIEEVCSPEGRGGIWNFTILDHKLLLEIFSQLYLPARFVKT